MSTPTPETDAIRKQAMMGYWSITEKGWFLDLLEGFERQRNAARDDAERLAKSAANHIRSSKSENPYALDALTSALAAHEALSANTQTTNDYKKV